MLAQRKLDIIVNSASCLKGNTISSIEFYMVLQEVAKYLPIKDGNRNQTKMKLKKITKEQREELLKQVKKKANNFSYAGFHAEFKVLSTSTLQNQILFSIKTIKLT